MNILKQKRRGKKSARKTQENRESGSDFCVKLATTQGMDADTNTGALQNNSTRKKRAQNTFTQELKRAAQRVHSARKGEQIMQYSQRVKREHKSARRMATYTHLQGEQQAHYLGRSFAA
ncbi:MAG: hypothetical protein ACAH88_21105 [Roseimicrobium sp.]